MEYEEGPLNANPQTAGLGEAFELIRPRLLEVERLLERQIGDGPPTVRDAGAYVLEGGGKRLRPAMLLTVARLLGYRGDLDIAYAAVVEMIHTATLVHDDIIDHAEVRRGRVTANNRWGNQLGVLLGDWLYIRSMEIALALGDQDVMRLLSRATVEMVEGEILGLELKGSMSVTRDQYLDIVRRKTAELFAACCSTPAHFSPAHAAYREPLARFGRHLGVCFQIVDDLLDVTASEASLGKPVFSDLREGKLTLPFILLLPHLDAPARDSVQRVLTTGQLTPGGEEELRSWLETSGALQETRAVAEGFGRAAVEALEPLPDSPERRVLAAAPTLVLNRRS